MPDFYTEQMLETPLTAAAEQLLIDKLHLCARDHNARSRNCLVDGERRRMLFHFEAEDLRAARAAALCSGLDPDATWLSPVDRVTAGDGTAVDLVHVVAEYRRDAPLDVTRLRAGQHACAWCLEAFRVHPGPVVVSADGRRVLALFRAPDAEAVRMAHRHADEPFDRVVALQDIGPESTLASGQRKKRQQS